MNKNIIEEFINITNTIDETNSKLKVLRTKSKDLKGKIVQDMVRNNLELINLTSGGKIEKVKRKEKEKIKQSSIKEKIRKRMDQSQAERLIEDIYEKRSIVECEKIIYKKK